MKHTRIILTAMLCLCMTACGNQAAQPSLPADTTAGTDAVSESASETESAAPADTSDAPAEAESASETPAESDAETAAEPETPAAASDEAADPNAFYPVTNAPATSVSVVQFEGSWFNAANPIESIQFRDCELLRGSFTMDKADLTSTEGYIQLEYRQAEDGTQEYFYNLYAEDGRYLFSIATSVDIPFTEFRSTDGRQHYMLQQD